jgi:hypothetical protein
MSEGQHLERVPGWPRFCPTRSGRYPRRVAVPDAVEPVVGWRCWRVADGSDGLVLMSAHHPMRWAPGWAAEASCSAPHAVPHENCSCGIYAARDPGRAVAYLPPHLKATLRARQPEILGYDVVMALGRVDLWGKVVEAEWGWRAERGYPRELFLPAGVRHYRRSPSRVAVLDAAAVSAALAELYGVPVRATATLEPGTLAA